MGDVVGVVALGVVDEVACLFVLAGGTGLCVVVGTVVCTRVVVGVRRYALVDAIVFGFVFVVIAEVVFALNVVGGGVSALACCIHCRPQARV